MSVWATKRKFIISSSIFIPLIVVAVFLYITGREKPSCFDGLINQDERGVDCGGSCVAVCQNEAEDVAILWTRFLPVIDDVYSVVTLIENSNKSFEAKNVPYSFKLFDEEGVLIYERKGSAFFPAGSTFPIFEHALRTGERVPSRAVFSLRNTPFWEQREFEKIPIQIVSKNLDQENTPKLTAVIKNNSLKNLSQISFIAMLFDADGNLVNASKTVLSTLGREASDTIVFTWPEDFKNTVVRTEIVPVEYTAN
ncbi:hypothetical protein COW81_03220 [Candidatus Campbellbacteria bacterium CG22_combo_CG10-13_8_21_14_all_36_13]|uniref:Uncharacterized protein n=1 Tax=Candidatus Campbellbacteria bacterium CG22_combo_CG10-13_8_21_14_all_36_13 TaxID=1974529 RepID=A0A2H0DXJ1_9BACT|nr:MAG: hypothetical protein COW81_03220 [Candidatus Campbellbacteria bacterium CG22_combo_CG10-13_8_21_14_all_36_13]